MANLEEKFHLRNSRQSERKSGASEQTRRYRIIFGASPIEPCTCTAWSDSSWNTWGFPSKEFPGRIYLIWRAMNSVYPLSDLASPLRSAFPDWFFCLVTSERKIRMKPWWSNFLLLAWFLRFLPSHRRSKPKRLRCGGRSRRQRNPASRKSLFVVRVRLCCKMKQTALSRLPLLWHDQGKDQKASICPYNWKVWTWLDQPNLMRWCQPACLGCISYLSYSFNLI